MNILVTGGAGFIGSHLIDKLLEFGYSIICIDNFDLFYDRKIKLKNLSNALRHVNFRLYEVDIRNKELICNIFKYNQIDLVIHLAAKAGVRPSIVNSESYIKTNVIGTLNILEAMKIYKINKMIFASSSSVYGNNNKVPFSENDPVDYPISPYAASKKAGELLCYTYHHLFGFDIFGFRFFTVYGPRQRPDLAIHKFTNLILNDQYIEIYGDGSSSRDYTYIDDICDGVIKAIEKLKGFEIFNLGESKTIELNEMINILEKCIGKTAKKIYLPYQPGDVLKTYADISKAKQILGYNPHWDFEEGIKQFIKWKKG